MIRANDKGLATPPPVVVEGAPKRRLPIPPLTPRNLIVIVGAVAWLLVIFLFVIPQVFGKKPAPAAAQAGKAGAQAQAAAQVVPQAVVTVEPGVPGGAVAAPKAAAAPTLALKDRVINLSNNVGYRYAKLTFVVVFADEGNKFAKAKGEAAAKLETAFVADNQGAINAFNDILTSTVSAKTAADLATPQGKEALRQELIGKFNQALAGRGRVTWIDFTDFVMQ
ncbi:MAG: flagellar basal body-associated FliL family protein [Chloroflexota bacterium]|nr:flagellar basal body-associated FliL family protein [Chloroflexota bacterium]